MERTTALACGLLTMLGLWTLTAWVKSRPSVSLSCPPTHLRFERGPQGESIAECSETEISVLEIPAAAALTLQRKPHLNALTREELARLPGVGRTLAHQLAQVRDARGGFSSWADVDEVRGVGAQTLERLQALTTLDEEGRKTSF